jgi:predicted dehydrogenase
MAFKIAVMGFRHGHIYSLVDLIKQRSDTELVAVCEEDRETRERIIEAGVCETVFDSYEQMLDSIECDAIGVGDYYAKRGPIAIAAMRRGKHIVSDKPLCSSLHELHEIESLARREKLSVSCQFDMRSSALFRTVRRLIAEGTIGEVHAISFNGQHPLMYGTRPQWYFEEGKHGGTINDIAIHAIDYIPWLTGLNFTNINAARNWNARLKEVPQFKDAAQMMLTLENGAGVLGDVSYLTPDSFGYTLPQYWLTLIWGSDGLIEAAYGGDLKLFKNGEKEPRTVETDAAMPGAYLDSFLKEIEGETQGLELTTAAVLHSSRVALRVQQAADEGLTNVSLA